MYSLSGSVKKIWFKSLGHLSTSFFFIYCSLFVLYIRVFSLPLSLFLRFLFVHVFLRASHHKGGVTRAACLSPTSRPTHFFVVGEAWMNSGCGASTRPRRLIGDLARTDGGGKQGRNKQGKSFFISSLSTFFFCSRLKDRLDKACADTHPHPIPRPPNHTHTT